MVFFTLSKQLVIIKYHFLMNEYTVFNLDNQNITFECFFRQIFSKYYEQSSLAVNSYYYALNFQILYQNIKEQNRIYQTALLKQLFLIYLDILMKAQTYCSFKLFLQKTMLLIVKIENAVKEYFQNKQAYIMLKLQNKSIEDDFSRNKQSPNYSDQLSNKLASSKIIEKKQQFMQSVQEIIDKDYLKSIYTEFQIFSSLQKYQHQNRSLYNLMLTIQKISQTVKKVDMFSSSEMLRYSEDSQYHTFTGGLISLGIIFTVIAGFFSMISETINRTAISSSLNALINYDPSPYNLTTNAENMFMFGIQIQSNDLSLNYDFNGPRRYFDVTSLQFILSYGIVQSSRQLPLVQCTDEHWKMLPEIVSKKDKIMYDAWLCPPLDSKYLLQGSYFSETFTSLLIMAQKCTNQSDPARPCYPQNEIDDFFAKYGNFYFTINYVNTVINPGEVSYLSYYLESMDFAIISAGTGSELYYQFSDFHIETDTSIWPFSSFQYNKGALISQRVSPKPYMMGEGPNYIVAYLAKSSQSLFYRRQVQKLSLVISYMGGLVGAISAVLFFLKIYTDLSLQVSIAQGIFTIPQNKHNKDITQTQGPIINNTNNQTKKEKEKTEKKSFNIFIFIKLLVYRLFKDFKFTEGWTGPKQIQVLRQQISKHLDVKILLQRLTNLQRCLSYVFDDDQLKCLRYLKKISIEEVKYMRTVFSNEIKDEELIEQQQQSQNQLYTLQMNNNFDKKEVPKSNLFQNLSPQHISNVRNMLSADNSDFCDKIEAKKKTNKLVSQNHFPEQKFNEGFVSKKVINCFYNLQKMKQTDNLSKRIWQNLDEKAKQQLANKGEKKVAFNEDREQEKKEQNKKKSYFHIQLPSIIMEKRI